VVCYGPSMEDFRGEKELLEKVGAGIPIADGNELLTTLRGLMTRPETLAARGEAARDAVIANQGASKRYADLIIRVLGGKPSFPRRSADK